MLEQNVFIAAMQLTYLKRSSDTKVVTAEINWTFELGLQSRFDVSIRIPV